MVSIAERSKHIIYLIKLKPKASLSIGFGPPNVWAFLFLLNNNMSDKDNKEKSNRGGVREGAGRPPGSKNKINKATIQTVLDKLYDRTGHAYEDLLIEDFLQARISNEALAHKYHSLLANKLMPDLNALEVNENEDLLTAKQRAFAEAIAQITTIRKEG